MATESNDENKLKQCIQLLIDTISNTTTKQSLDDLRTKFQIIFKQSLSSLSTQCRNYLLNILYQYHYDDQEKTFSNAFTDDSFDSFVHDLQGCLASLDVFQSVWNGDQSKAEEFISNYPHLKDKSGLYHTTLLYSAARNNHFQLVQYLVEEARCSVNAQNEEYLEKGQQTTTTRATIGSTPLHAACYQGHFDIVRYLISHGGDYYILNNAHETPVENGKSKSNIRQFFQEFLIGGYSMNLTNIPKRKIYCGIEIEEKLIIDCIWEYKPIAMEHWMSFTGDIANELQQSMINKPFESEIRLKTGRDRFHISLSKYLRSGSDNSSAWIRCRGSSMLNFQSYSQWQMMFIRHPTGTINPSPSLDILDMTSGDNIQFNSWYTVDEQLNLILETAINSRRRYLNMYLEILQDEKMIFNFEDFLFTNQQQTIVGFLRWIPKFISDTTDLTPIEQLPDDSQMMLLTTSCVKQAYDNGNLSAEEMHYYFELAYENAFQDDDLDISDQDTDNDNPSNDFIKVIQGDLLREKTDVIVICSSSKYLMDAVYKAGGKSLKSDFDKKTKENDKHSVISIPATGAIESKAIYFVPWKPNVDENLLCQSIEQLVKNVMKKAASENYQSIAFPAIGCGGYECSTSLIAKTFVNQCQELLTKYSIAIVFVIQPDKIEIYEEFHQRISPLKHGRTTMKEPPVSLTIENGIIEVKKGDITEQQVDVIIGSLSSENLTQILFKAAGDQTRMAYNKEQKANPNALIIETPSGHLHCKRIFFLKWEPNKDQNLLQKSLIDLISNVIKTVRLHQYTSIAFPAIGCGEHACSVDIVVKTMVREMKQQIEKERLPWTVKFIVHPSQQNVYDEFCKQLLFSDQVANDYQLPSTWERSNDDDNQLRFLVSENTEEYNSIIRKFDEQMQGNYTEIVKLERIQNERWYMQYVAHRKDFRKRLGMDTEKRLYHGCPEVPADLIINDCFNRSFAGVNGTVYGFGVYFSSRATYSHGYATPNDDGEQCMFVCRVLAGKTTKGDDTMKTRPFGFDSTTDGVHMTVTYHDAQAYAEYLITYR